MSRLRDWRPMLLLISLAVIVLDRASKIWVSKNVAEGSGGITIIPHVFNITHVQNSGAGFSMFADSMHPDRTRWMLVAFSILAALVVLGVLLRVGRRLTLTSLAMALILGGALGNAWDRIFSSTVTDFLAVFIYHYHWPDFNIADSAIVVGGILLVLGSFKDDRAQSSERRAQ